MSTVFSQARARVASVQPGTSTKSSPRLIVVHGAPFRPPRMPFVLFVVALLAGGLVGLLLLNTELQRGTFQITALNQQAGQLRDQQEALERQVRTLESPQNLADQALRMGMVPNPNPVFLRLSDGKVLGVPTEGRAGTGTAMFAPDQPARKPVQKPVQKPTAQTTMPPLTQTTKPPTTQATKPPTTQTAQTTKPPIKPSNKPTQTARTTTTNGG
jgi:cell division protein FtsB